MGIIGTLFTDFLAIAEKTRTLAMLKFLPNECLPTAGPLWGGIIAKNGWGYDRPQDERPSYFLEMKMITMSTTI